MNFTEGFLLALSINADCFAVALCSSLCLKEIRAKHLALVTICFAVIQALFFALGWGFGHLFVGVVSRISKIVGFLLLLYVGLEMIIGAYKKQCSQLNLSGFKNIIIGGVATSIDALAVGASLSLEGISRGEVSPVVGEVFLLTAIAVVAGMTGGRSIGMRVGHIAEAIGGLVLIIIGLQMLL